MSIRQDTVQIIGKLPDDADTIPITPPNGFIWITGGSIGGVYEAYGIADVRVRNGSKSMDFVITLADAISLRGLLDQAISAMQDSEDKAFEGGVA